MACEATELTTPLMPASKLSARRSMPVLRSASAAALSRSVSSRSRSASIMLVLNTATVSAIWPISSLRPTPGISTVLSPPASARIATHMRTTGREMPRPISQASTDTRSQPGESQPHDQRFAIAGD